MTNLIPIRIAHLVIPKVSLLDRYPKICPDSSEEVPEVYTCGIRGVHVGVPWEMWVDETHEGEWGFACEAEETI